MNVDLSEEGGRFEAREVIAATLKPWVLQRTLEELREAFNGTGVAPGHHQTNWTRSIDRASTTNRRGRAAGDRHLPHAALTN